MTGIIIAAGRGRRMGALTATSPKCLLPVGRTTILANSVQLLREAGCDKIVIIGGYLNEKLSTDGVTVVINHDYERNNVLHSLLTARSHVNGEVLVLYSDVWFEPEPIRRMAQSPGAIVLGVDQAWRHYYRGRTEHTEAEAEMVYFNDRREARLLGKNISPLPSARLGEGEFMGLLKLSDAGSAQLVGLFDRLNQSLSPTDSFQRAAKWSEAYLTDLLQEAIDTGTHIGCELFDGGWSEIDTEQDYLRLISTRPIPDNP